ncbi:MAG: outer membrane beta-barrel protein [Candidatus Aminicenantes bacterium]|nr:outer membrane beta-barrel protein [Candidatus Aminicenantes bacterium]
MKKFLIVLFVMGLFSSLSFSQFSFRFYGGMAHVVSKDVNSAINANNEILDLYDPGHTGYFEKLCCGADFGGELFYKISNHLSMGINIEFIRLRNESNLSYNMGVPLDQTSTYGINALPIMLNVHYSLPITSLLSAYVSAGAGYVLVDIDYMVDFLWDFGAYGNAAQIYTFQNSQGTLGVQVQWGIEVFVAKNISLLVGGMGRMAKLTDIEGDWTNDDYPPGFSGLDKSGSGHYFWYYEESIMGKNYPQVYFGKDAPTGAANARKGELNLSGLSFTAGIKIGLDFKKK